MDQTLAARMLDDMINAAAELWRWAPDLDQAGAVRNYARPMMFGLTGERIPGQAAIQH